MASLNCRKALICSCGDLSAPPPVPTERCVASSSSQALTWASQSCGVLPATVTRPSMPMSAGSRPVSRA
jgi:hypothetical protein